MDDGIVILPQKVLNNQICSECCNYLSVGPVIMYQGKKICGRCTTQDYYEGACLSLYEKIAHNCIFKCINHYSGCKEVLLYNKAIDHEKMCKEASFKCPYCEFKGNGCQLIHHFKKIHPKYTAQNNTFPILLEPGSCNLIFAKNDDLLCVTLHISDECINISNLLAARDNNAHLKYFKLIFFNPNSSVQYVTPEVLTNTNWELYDQGGSLQLAKGPIMNCFPSGKCLVKVNFIHSSEDSFKHMKWLQKSITSSKNQLGRSVRKWELWFYNLSDMNTAELKKFVCTRLKNLQLCVNCGQFVNDENKIYLCLNHHIACESCSYKKCQKCNVFSQWNKPTFDHLSLECDWEGCSQHVNILNFLLHKQRCPQRRYQCPAHNCRYNAHLQDFKKHWHLTPYTNKSDKVEFSGSCACYCFIPFCNEFVHVTIERSDKMITVNVNEEQVVLSHAYDVNMYYSTNSRSILSLPQQKWEYSQSRVARTLFVPIPTDCTSLYLSFLKPPLQEMVENYADVQPRSRHDATLGPRFGSHFMPRRRL